MRDICPAAPGVKDWQPSAFSPRTGLLYIPHQNLCMDVEGVEANYIAGTPYVGMNVKMYAGPGGNRGEFTAWDPVDRQGGVEDQGRSSRCGAARVVTAGDVVFYGTMDGWFKAVDARTGNELWQFKTGSGIIGQPVTYRGPDGKQYVAVLSGVGGWSGGIVAGGLDARDSSAALGFVNAMKDLPGKSTKGGSSMSSRCRNALALAALVTAHGRGPGPRAPRVRRSQQLPFTNREGRDSRTGSPSWSRAICTPASAYTWWAQRRGFIRNTLNASFCDVVMAVPSDRRLAVELSALRPRRVWPSRSS